MASYQIGNPAWTEDYRRLMFGGSHQSTTQSKAPTYPKTTAPTNPYSQPRVQASAAKSPVSQTVEQENPYTSMYEQAIARQEQAKNERLAMLGQMEKRMKETQNATTGEALRQAYVRNMQAKRDLPQELTALGASGGLSESALMQQDARYGEGRIGLENERADRLAEISSQIAAQKSDVLSGYYDTQASLGLEGAKAQQSYAEMLQQREYERNQALQNQQYQMQLAQQKAVKSQQKSQQKTLESKAAQAWMKQAEHNFNRPEFQNSTVQNAWANDSRYSQSNQIALGLEMAIKYGQLSVEEAKAIAGEYGLKIQ